MHLTLRHFLAKWLQLQSDFPLQRDFKWLWRVSTTSAEVIVNVENLTHIDVHNFDEIGFLDGFKFMFLITIESQRLFSIIYFKIIESL